jgi:hypothetical protein
MKEYKIAYMTSALLALLCSCSGSGERTASISGVVSGAEGELLILEHLGSGRPVALDTVKLAEDGAFKFQPALEAGPDYFNLRLGGQVISLVVDTLGTPLQLTASGRAFSTDYVVSGSEENQRLKEASLLVGRLRQQVADMTTAVRRSQMTPEVWRDSIYTLVNNCKQEALTSYIYVSPTDAASYYLLFQTVNGVALFDPYIAEDNRAFGAVATGWKYNYPNSPRVRHLEKMTLEGRAARQQAARAAAAQDSLLDSKIEQRNYFDLELPDNRDRMVSLSSLVDAGQVVLLDFTAHSLPASVGHNMKLAEAYNKYHAEGLAIYQVCLDTDENFWKTSADNVAWTVVRDRDVRFDSNGSVYSYPASLYNVTELPTTYIFNRRGEIVGRIASDGDLDASVRREL